MHGLFVDHRLETDKINPIRFFQFNGREPIQLTFVEIGEKRSLSRVNEFKLPFFVRAAVLKTGLGLSLLVIVWIITS